MVFHLYERIFGNFGDPKSFTTADKNAIHLVAEGFSEEEAANLSWFHDKLLKGKVYGTLTGLFVVFATDRNFREFRAKLPFFALNTWALPAARLATVWTFYMLGDYLATHPFRRGANTYLSYFYTNNEYLVTKDKFLNSFEVFNRKFTPEEITQFYIRHAENSKPRRWIYNPHIHGDKDSFQKSIDAVHSDLEHSRDLKNRIIEENIAKAKAGEKIEMKPYTPNVVVDRTGLKQHFDKFPLGGWKPLH